MRGMHITAKLCNGFDGVIILGNEFICMIHSLRLSIFKNVVSNIVFKCRFEFGYAHSGNGCKPGYCKPGRQVIIYGLFAFNKAVNIMSA